MLRVVSRENIVISELDFLEGEHSYFIDSDTSSLDDFFALFDKKFSLMPAEYLEICKTLGIAGPERVRVAPASVLKKEASLITADMDSIFSDENNVKYLKNYVKMRTFLDTMHSAALDEAALEDLIASQKHIGVKSNLQSFKNPVPVRYSMSSSSTGRLSVKEGPKILTSPNEVKSVFRSRYENGSLLQIDLSCAEPNFALFAASRPTIRDVYSFCANEVLQGKVDRSAAKLVLLSAIYGQSTKNLSANIPAGINAASVAKSVKSFLSVPELQSGLEKAWASGTLRNHLGRPLKSSKQRVLVSHYLQSSIAEASILMFDKFCSTHDVTPIFVIHDALIVDCKPSVSKCLLEIENFDLIYENEKFPASVTKLG